MDLKRSALSDASTLHLLVELLKDGKAEIIPELHPFEPIDMDLIVSILTARLDVNFGQDTVAWCNWYVEHCVEASAQDKQTLSMLRQMVETTRYYVTRIEQRRKRST